MRVHRLAALPTALALLTAPAILRHAVAHEAPTTALGRLERDVRYLASDEQGGRAPGTPGIERAAEYIADAFREAGLEPAEGLDGYLQPFEITGATKLGRGQELAARVGDGMPIDGRLRRDFMPLSIGGRDDLSGLPVVFAGYGITTVEDEPFSYDDYEGIDAEGKAVLILRRAPGYNEAGGPFSGDGGLIPEYATFRHKAVNAFQHGAEAVLLVNDEAGLAGDEDELLLFTSAGTERFTTIPFVMLRRAFADRILEAAGTPSLSELEDAINTGDEPTPRSLALDGVTLDATINVERPTIVAKNVVGVLEGAGPLADETIVVGAHYDHLGAGGMGSLAPFSREVHNGADDNASGTAMIMELARRLAARPDAPPRRIVFIAFSAEERGLLGSRHYVEDAPLYPLDQTVAMFNFDMVGRLDERRGLTVFGVDSTPGLRELVVALGTAGGLDIRPNAQVAGNSDHAGFFENEIPVVFCFTGTHRDYHRPSDDVEKVNFEGMARIADFAELLLLDFLRRAERPVFTKTESAAPERRVANVSVSLGTIPDYDESVEGVRLNGVREGSAAEEAGLQTGDVIVRFGDRRVGTIYDFMEGLSEHEPGDRVPIVVERDGEDVTLEAELDPASPRGAHGDE